MDMTAKANIIVTIDRRGGRLLVLLEEEITAVSRSGRLCCFDDDDDGVTTRTSGSRGLLARAVVRSAAGRFFALRAAKTAGLSLRSTVRELYVLRICVQRCIIFIIYDQFVLSEHQLLAMYKGVC